MKVDAVDTARGFFRSGRLLGAVFFGSFSRIFGRAHPVSLGQGMISGNSLCAEKSCILSRQKRRVLDPERLSDAYPGVEEREVCSLSRMFRVIIFSLGLVPSAVALSQCLWSPV